MKKRNIEPNKYDEINQILDKMLELKSSEENISFRKRCIIRTGCIGALIVVATLCVMLYKNNFSIESLISLLLAFFSIFISVFFYFKADEASNRFYDTSYNFMKDVSVTLGKIEERFGEKLNSINDKISHLAKEQYEKQEELENAEDGKQAIIEDLMQKAKLSDEEREEYNKKLSRQDRQIMILKQELMRLSNIEKRMREASNSPKELRDYFNQRELQVIENIPFSKWPETLKNKYEKILSSEVLPKYLRIYLEEKID